jgi:hypothetical protein
MYTPSTIRVALSAVVAAAVGLAAGGALAAPGAATLEDLPVREVTIFKDGHAFVTHEGKLRVADGAVIFEHVPEPVLGAFWPYVRDRRATLTSVVAGNQDVAESRPATTLAELIRANIGKPVTLVVQIGGKFEDVSGTIVAVPTHAVQRTVTTQPQPLYDPYGRRYVPQPPHTQVETVTEGGGIVLVREDDGGLRPLTLASIVSATFPADARTTLDDTVQKPRLRLNIEGARGETTVGMTYLQKGLRWIPEYAVLIEDGGKARIKLQATIVNDMIDLHGVTIHLVVGVPNFMFKGQLSPMALREAAAQLSQYFDARSSTGYAFARARMTEMRDVDAAAPSAGIEQPMDVEAEAIGPHEDLFLYKVEHVSLKKGERMVVPVIEVEVSYTDAYTWEIPFCPSWELLNSLNTQQRDELLQRYRSARVHHKLRIKNESKVPFTTGPALILKDGRLVAQTMLTYTSVGNEVDVDVTVATDIHAKKWEKQIGREDGAKVINGHKYTRLDMRGFLELTNFKKEKVTVEVTRAVLGTLTKVSDDGEITHLNSFEDLSYLPEGGLPYWHDWYARWWHYWPWWWHYANDIGQVKWTITLEPGEKRQIEYDWHYFVY